MLINCVAYQEGKRLADIPVEQISDYGVVSKLLLQVRSDPIASRDG